MRIDPCANCLVKHINLVMAFCDEGKSLDGAKEFMGLFDEIDSFMPGVLDTVLSCSSGGACEVKEPEKMQELVQSVRKLRRVVGMAVFGIDSDIVHDITEEDNHTPPYNPSVNETSIPPSIGHEQPHEAL